MCVAVLCHVVSILTARSFLYVGTSLNFILLTLLMSVAKKFFYSYVCTLPLIGWVILLDLN